MRASFVFGLVVCAEADSCFLARPTCEAATHLGARERREECGEIERDFTLFKVRQLLPQLDLRQRISVKKKQ